MPLIKNGELAAHTWKFPAATDPLPATGDIVLDLFRLIETGDVAFDRNGRIGVALPNDADLGLIAARMGRIDLITIDFPGFADGRGFSLAHDLRHIHRYRGEIWASGYLIPDQYPHIRACGFDAVLVRDDIYARQGEAGWTGASTALSLRYQLSHGDYNGGPQSILNLRRQSRQLEAAE